jgi:hypothetical protein
MNTFAYFGANDPAWKAIAQANKECEEAEEAEAAAEVTTYSNTTDREWDAMTEDERAAATAMAENIDAWKTEMTRRRCSVSVHDKVKNLRDSLDAEDQVKQLRAVRTRESWAVYAAQYAQQERMRAERLMWEFEY